MKSNTEETTKSIRLQKKKDLIDKADKKVLENVEAEENKILTHRNRRLPDSRIFWCMLALTRVYLASIQTGYIHPDEFHQSLQVMAYDVLDIDGAKPWEFSSSSPIRSVMFSGLMSLPYVILRYISPFAKFLFDIEILTPRMLIIGPRLFMTLLSFISDFCVYRIASMCYVRPWQCVEVFAGSYIMLVYSTRTFSNSIELILFSLLLWRVCLSMVDSVKVMRKENVLQDLYESADTMKEKVKIARIKNKLPAYNYVDSFVISLIVTYGVFVRPTFLVFSFVPLAYWLQRGVVTREVDFSYFNWRCASLLPGVFLTFLTCMLADSFYFSSLTLPEMLRKNITVASFTVTPINFLLYNSKEKNLSEHGLHPYLLHIAVNIPILHGVLGLAGLWSVSRYFANLVFRRMGAKPKLYSLATMLLCSFVFPVLALSVIPHQEPRFLLPTLVPLTLLHSDKISIYALPKFRFTKHFLFLMWQVWNILCVVFFGFMHQGGVTKTLVYIHDYVAAQPPTARFEVFFSHMYSPPTFLLMRKIPVIAETEEGRRYRVERGVTTHDLGGSLSMTEVFLKLLHARQKDTDRNKDLILCITASLSDGLHQAAPANVTLELLRRVPGHISTEHFPDFNVQESDLSEQCNKACYLTKKVKEFSVDVFKVKFGTDEKHTPKTPNVNAQLDHDEL